MQLKSNAPLKITEIQVNDSIELEFHQGIGIFKFSMKEKDLKKIISKCLDLEYTIEKRDQTVVYFCSNKSVDLNFYFHYNKRGLDYLSIHTSDLTLNGVNIKNMKQAAVIDLVERYHTLNFVGFKYTLEDIDDEVFINFTNIGLSIWFEEEKITDICVNR